MKNLVFCIIFLSIFFDCKAQEQDLRLYNIAESQLENGIVKKFMVIEGEDKSLFYDIIKKGKKGVFSVTRYDEWFKVFRRDTYLITDSCFILNSLKYLIKGEMLDIIIIKPRIVSFSSKSGNSVSEIILPYKKPIIYRDSTVFGGYKKFRLHNKLLNSIELVKYQTMSKKKQQDIKSRTIDIFAKNIGWIYSKTKNYNTKETSVVALLELMSIEEFEELKDN